MSGPTADPRRADLDRRVLEWLRESDFRSDDARFDALARDLFAFQFEHCAAYGAFCRGRDQTPDTIRDWREIPAVPTGAFKEMALHSFPAEYEVKQFRTSGTSTAKPGTLHLDTLEIYEASLLPTFRRFVLPDLAPHARIPIRVLAPSDHEAPTSSLSHMFASVLREFGSEDSGFDVSDGELRSDGLCAALESRAAAGEPLLLCGTAFAFVHLLDDLEQRSVQYRLPEGSRLMECGGFKGRSREIPRTELYARLEDALGIPMEHMLNQYGMTELGSQFYDSVLVQPDELRRKLGPPWVRVALVDPNSGAAAANGASGQIVVYDLANTGSVFAIQTADLGRAVGDGFEVLGREPGSESRGCSIAADAMLGGSAQ
jgi:hypothetical protein